MLLGSGGSNILARKIQQGIESSERWWIVKEIVLHAKSNKELKGRYTLASFSSHIMLCKIQQGIESLQLPPCLWEPLQSAKSNKELKVYVFTGLDAILYRGKIQQGIESRGAWSVLEHDKAYRKIQQGIERTLWKTGPWSLIQQNPTRNWKFISAQLSRSSSSTCKIQQGIESLPSQQHSYHKLFMQNPTRNWKLNTLSRVLGRRTRLQNPTRNWKYAS